MVVFSNGLIIRDNLSVMALALSQQSQVDTNTKLFGSSGELQLAETWGLNRNAVEGLSVVIG
jgi:hypothetical protein